MHPFDRIAQQLATGQIGFAEAERQVRDPDVLASLDASFLERMLRVASALRQERRWQRAIPLTKILLAAVDAAGPALDARHRHLAVIVFVENVATALWHVADRRLYDEALARGQAVLEQVRVAGDAGLQAEAAFALGVLHLEPYTTHRAVRRAELVRQEWGKRLHQGETWDGRHFPSSTLDAFPGPSPCLDLAAGFLAEALRAATGRRKLDALKAWLETLDARASLGNSPLAPDLSTAIAEALASLDDLPDLSMRVEILARLQTHGFRPTRANLDDLVARAPRDGPLDERIPGDSVALLLNLASMLEREGRPADGLRLLVEAGGWLTLHARDDLRRQWLRELRELLGASHAAAGLVPTSGPVGEFVRELPARAAAEGWSAEKLAAVALHAARRALDTHEARVVIPWLDSAMQAPSLLPYHLAALALRAGLLWDAGDRQATTPDEAMAYYAFALADAVAVADAAIAERMLTALQARAREAAGPGLERLAAVLPQLVIPLESLLGDAGMRSLQTVLGAALLRLVRVVRDGRTTHALLRIAKGFRFGTMLRTGAAPRFRPDRRCEAMRREIAALQDADPLADLPRGDGRKLDTFGELLLVSPQARTGVDLAGENAAERLLNLQFRLDAWLDDRLAEVAAARPLDPAFPVPANVGPETVILDSYLAVEDRTEFLIHYARTPADGRLGAVQLPPETASRYLVGDGVAADLGETAARILSLRAALILEPDDEATTDVAAESLRRQSPLLLGELPPVLADWRAEGRRHLCLVPHGPLAIAPIHLLPAPDRPLAEDWIVTVLPSFDLLRPRSTESADHRLHDLTAIGVTFRSGNPWGLGVIDDVQDEVRAVARTMDGRVLLDEGATRSAILEALTTSCRVHLATHGAHHAYAASSQRLFCQATATEPGHLHAHELLGLDLRGLDLVTLSACETTLGRFDLGGNPRGLAATLFLAGARTIVGTLWTVDSACAVTFFTAFYETLSATGDKREAFYQAQCRTRAVHPRLVDWGAFQFVGDWR